MISSPTILMRTLLLGVAIGTSVSAQDREADRSLWLLSRFDSVPRQNAGSLVHCGEMERIQRILATRRDSITALQETGRARREACKDSACLRSLQPLRDSLRSISAREASSRVRLGRESSLCPDTQWKRWQRWRTLDSLQDSMMARPTAEWVQERAELAWTANLEERLAGTTISLHDADRLVTERFHDPDASCRWRLRQAFVLRWTRTGDSPVRLLDAVSNRSDCPEESAVAHHWLGMEPSLGDSSRMFHLRRSLDRPDLRGRSLLELSALLANHSRWTPAFDTLALALRTSPELLLADHVDSLARWADQAGFDPIQRIASTPWLDRLLLARSRLLLATGRGRAAQVLLADFRLRFPGSPLWEEARELLARSRK
ncbi:MAG TPA: hypothetical protein PKO15_09525 [Fibrobacteria bacterium]|nr:hypothetical protein [Fibrobacteria bacterium]